MGGRALKLSILCISGFLFISHTATTARRDGAGGRAYNFAQL